MANPTGVFEKPKGSGIYWARVIHNGKRICKKIGRRSDAVAYRAKMLHQLNEGKLFPERNRKAITFKQLSADAMAEAHGEQHRAELELKFNLINKVFGDKLAESVTRTDIRQWLSTQAKERNWKPATVNRWQAAFSLAFRVGQDNELVDRNPAARLRRKVDNIQVRYLSPDEDRKLRTVIQRRCPHNLPAFDLSLHTGMRSGEQFSLQWKQVDFERRTITLVRTKSGKPRVIPLNPVALSALLSLNRQSNGSQFVHLNRYGQRLQGHRDWMDPVIEEAALEGYHWHVNRHTFASRLAMAGVSLQAIGDLLGHASYQMTLRYAHLCPEFTASAVNRLCDPQSDTKSDTSTFNTEVVQHMAVN